PRGVVSFPTRRSSDLRAGGLGRAGAVAEPTSRECGGNSNSAAGRPAAADAVVVRRRGNGTGAESGSDCAADGGGCERRNARRGQIGRATSELQSPYDL